MKHECRSVYFLFLRFQSFNSLGKSLITLAHGDLERVNNLPRADYIKKQRQNDHEIDLVQHDQVVVLERALSILASYELEDTQCQSHHYGNECEQPLCPIHHVESDNEALVDEDCVCSQQA